MVLVNLPIKSPGPKQTSTSSKIGRTSSERTLQNTDNSPKFLFIRLPITPAGSIRPSLAPVTGVYGFGGGGSSPEVVLATLSQLQSPGLLPRRFPSPVVAQRGTISGAGRTRELY